MSALRNRSPQAATLLLLAALLAAPQAQAGQAFVLQQNLADMSDEAAMIYRGTVLDVSTGSIEIAGGELPTVTFMLEVTEKFKGEFTQKGDKLYAKMTVPGSYKPVLRREGDYALLNPLPAPPALEVGEEYLLLTNAPNAHGLSNTIGLAQGCFHITGQGKEEVVKNGANNVGLFRGMGLRSLASKDTITYDEIAAVIMDGLGQ